MPHDQSAIVVMVAKALILDHAPAIGDGERPRQPLKFGDHSAAILSMSGWMSFAGGGTNKSAWR